MIPSNKEGGEVESWGRFLNVRWERYVKERKLSEKAQKKQLGAFMAGGQAVLDAVLKFQSSKK